MKLLISALVCTVACSSWAAAAVLVSDPSTFWISLDGNYDYLDDQQTGQKAGDIVGEGLNRGLFVTFDDNGSASDTDGTIGFRLRIDDVDGPKKKPQFDRVAWIGIDADLSGSIDVFLGLNMQGSTEEIGVYSPGTDSNTSPNTTSIDATPYRSYALTSTNYNYRPVDYTTDGGTTNDATPATSGDPDHYVSFMVPFADVVSFLEGRAISITDQTPLRYVSATSTQANSLNQDLGGVDGGVNSSVTWEDLGGFSGILRANATAVPEPSAPLLIMGSVVGALGIRRRR